MLARELFPMTDAATPAGRTLPSREEQDTNPSSLPDSPECFLLQEMAQAQIEPNRKKTKRRRKIQVDEPAEYT